MIKAGQMTDTPIGCYVPTGSDAIELAWPGVMMALSFAAPQVSGEVDEGAWQHEGREQVMRVLAGCAGQLIRDTFTNGDLGLVREVWVDQRADRMAVRHVVTNRSGRALTLDALRPLHCTGPAGMTLDNRPAGQWEVLRQARLKNDVPSAVRLGKFDEDYQDAIQEIGEQGDSPTGADGQCVRLKMDSFGVLRSDDPSSETHLLVGFLSQTGHMAQLELETDEQRHELARFTAACTFDGCALPPGGERASQWVLLMRGDDPHTLIEAFADRVGQYHGVSQPTQRPPAVWCSWYYYGPTFYEEQLHAELAYLKENRLPFDVLLIDDSRPRPWGDWLSHPLWPSGMKDAADRIRALGYRPGIWTCPFLAKTHSQLAKDHPDWLLKRDDGEPVLFQMDGTSYVLDPTYPGVARHLEELFRTMTEDWGFTYHKLDFLRAVFMETNARYYDRSVTRLEAYERGLSAVRRGAGPDAYISVCGGHYGGSLGLADSQRSGSDVVACWDDPPALPAIKQNLMRTWMNRLWHTDADAMMVRRRDVPINDTVRGRLSLGRFTDEEARSITANQYVGGGILCATECFNDIEADRLALYRHVVPTLHSPGIPLDPFSRRCPSQMLNRIQPRCEALGPWVTVTVFNWTDEPSEPQVVLCDQVVMGLGGQRYVVYEIFEQRVIGVVDRGDAVVLPSVPAHGCRVLRIAPWHGTQAVLAGTDLHLSGGGVEVSAWRATADAVEGTIETRWSYPVRVTVAFPSPDGCMFQTITVDPAAGTFRTTAGEEGTLNAGDVPALQAKR